MTKKTLKDQCVDLTQTMTVEVPCGLAVRAEKFAEENETTLSSLVIEALDAFLRGRKKD